MSRLYLYITKPTKSEAMKNGIGIFTMLFLFPVWISIQPVTAQEKSREQREKERELTIQEEIDMQKKAIREQQKAHEDMQKELEKSKAEIEEAVMNIPGVPTPPENSGVRVFSYPRSSRSYSFDDHFMFTTPGRNFYSEEGGERSTWDFSKSVKEKTFSSDFTFNVEKSAKTVVMAVTGDCKSGEIRIKIVMPNGKTYSDIIVDESGNLNWRKSFNITEEENKSKTGEWKYEINGSNATGFFKISLQTF